MVAMGVMLAALAAGPADGPEPKSLFRPEMFETLVNPARSHCVDEARRPVLVGAAGMTSVLPGVTDDTVHGAVDARRGSLSFVPRKATLGSCHPRST